MQKDLLWKADVDDWEIVSVESYQFIIEQAKERLDEVISESNAITSRSMTLLLSYFAIFSGILGFIFSASNKSEIDFLTILESCVLAIFPFYIFTLLFALIASRYNAYKGSPPKEIFRQQYLQSHDSEDWLKILHYYEMERIQDKIERIQAINIKRVGQFRAVLRVSLLFVALFVFALLARILSAS